MAAYIPGIDVSAWEPDIDWRAVKAFGIKFAFMKATEGIAYVDKTFATNWIGAKRVGILRGAYHYLRGGIDAIQQADLFLKTVKFEAGDLPPVLDIENISNEDVSNGTMIDRSIAWLEKVESVTGRRPIIYSGPYFLRDRMRGVFGPPSWAMKYTLWLANYLDHYYDGALPMQPAGWQNWKIWQYSDKGQVDGINSGVDINWFRGTLEELYALAGGKEPEPTQYTVQQKDTFKSIADQYGLTIPELLAANPQLLQAGAVLKIPIIDVPVADKPEKVDTPVDVSVPPAPATRVYTVAAGDSLSAIAVKFHTTVDAICKANDITNPNLIQVGQVLKIP